MSFDLYVQVFDQGQPAGLPLQVLRDSFGRELVELEDDFWQVQFESDQSSDVFLRPLDGDASLIHSISIHRPCTDARLYEALWRLLGNPGAILYFPDGPSPLSRDSLAVASMPAEMVEALGPPVLISRASDISDAIGQP